METFTREQIYSGLKVYLSKEIEEKNKKKKNLLDERDWLENEKSKKKKMLFQTDESGERRKMFSPVNTIFYPSQGENFQDRKIRNLNYRIEELEKQAGKIENESDEIQTYLDCLEQFMAQKQSEKMPEDTAQNQIVEGQLEKDLESAVQNQIVEGQLEKDLESAVQNQIVEGQLEKDLESAVQNQIVEGQPKKDLEDKGKEADFEQQLEKDEPAKVEENVIPDVLEEKTTAQIEKQEAIEVCPTLQQTLENVEKVVRETYDNVEFLYDVEDKTKQTSQEENEYIVEILKNVIKTSVNKANADVFVVDIKNKENVQMDVEILANKEKIEYCTFCLK